MSTNPSPAKRRGTQRWLERGREAAQVPLPPGLDPEVLATVAMVFVAAHRREHGCGPTWRELGARLHPDCASVCGPQAPEGAAGAVRRTHTARVVRALLGARWLYASKRERSLDGYRPRGERASTSTP